MKQFIDKCKQYKAWNELPPELIQNLYEYGFDSAVGHFLCFFDGKGVKINAQWIMGEFYILEVTDTKNNKVYWQWNTKDNHFKDRPSAQKVGFLKGLEILEGKR
jgi:hypothetical protein